MPDGNGAVTARIVDGIESVPAEVWDSLAGHDNPFVSHAFLLALEETGCVSRRAGWLPHHLVVEDTAGTIVAVAPLYLKTHSQGEYVFDHGWAHAWERAGGSYYPKMQVSAPFSPVTGPRLLAGTAADADDRRLGVLRALEMVCVKMELSSVHVTFATRHEWDLMGAAGWIQRVGRQFHWHNRGYESFDDFLGELTSRKRKQIRRERRAIGEQGITVRPYVGDEIRPELWDAFYRFYVDTYDRKWGYPYLTREFFEVAQDRLGERVVLMIAERDGRPIAGALNLKGSDALYGRNWGSRGDYPFLHFETCYYQAIDFAIANQLGHVEAGTQGPHKVQRGYEPVETYSGHFIPNESFREAVERFCREEQREVEWEIEAIAAERLPFRQGD